jgi:hypothetical protein
MGQLTESIVVNELAKIVVLIRIELSCRQRHSNVQFTMLA